MNRHTRGEASRGTAWRGNAWPGESRHGVAWIGLAGPGAARQGLPWRFGAVKERNPRVFYPAGRCKAGDLLHIHIPKRVHGSAAGSWEGSAALFSDEVSLTHG